MKFLPKNTLAYFNAAPQVHLHNLANLPTKVLSVATADYRKTCGMIAPIDEAVTFYTLNHAASIVRKGFTPNEPLPDWATKILSTYTDVCVTQGERMLHYILSITVREMRHLKSSATSPMWNKINAEFGPKAVDYLKLIATKPEPDAVKEYMNNPPDLTVGDWTKAMSHAFHKGNWSGGYGGTAWGGITDALIAMITGVTSMEMLVDTGYTLAHNTAPIFNKAMMYTNPDKSTLMTVLDVQRGGQLLDLMTVSETMGVPKTTGAMEAMELIKANYPTDAQDKPTLKGYVDWKLVNDLRPDKDSHPSKYAKVMAAQKAKKGTVAPKAEPQVLATMLGKPVKVTGEWQVAPHQTVKILERVGG